MECAILPRVQQGGEDECWPWLGGLVMGYGAGTFHKRRYKVSRWMLERKTGEPLGELHALHTCDNRACCNPKHLFPGTPQDNMDDKVAKGRWKGGTEGFKGEAHPKAKLNEDAVKYIWSRRHTGKQIELAERLGVKRDVIWKVMKGRSWAYLTKDLP